ncbi:MAG: succinate dehydrogenase assembly factor 4 [Pseudomonadota bacterium]|jgi:hypothetical protein
MPSLDKNSLVVGGRPPIAVADAVGAPIALAPPLEPQAEIGGRSGPEPTRFGDWERAGRCIDF